MKARTNRLAHCALVACIVLAGSGSGAFALDCDTPYRLTPSETMAESDFVLRGVVIARVGGRHTVDVLTVWKGAPPDGPTLVEADELWGPQFEMGLDVLFYGFVSEQDGSRQLSPCGRSALFRPAEGEALGRPIWTSPEARAPFRRGDSDADGDVDLTDAIASLEHQFLGGFEPGCFDALDTDDSGELDLSDAVSTLTYLFLGGMAPAAPFESCGDDRTPDDLDCRRFEPCAVEPEVVNTIRSIVIDPAADRVLVTLHSTLPFPAATSLVLAVGHQFFRDVERVGDGETVVFTMSVEEFERTFEQAPVNAGPSTVGFDSPAWRDFGLWEKGIARVR